ncbi:MAG: ribosome small subunit-dependent GTPase A [Acetivibrionales bacterium]
MIISLSEGIILKGVGGFYDVLEDGGKNSLYTCKVRGIHRKEGGITPIVGDRVTFDVIDENKKEGRIDQILDRHNAFTRPAVANIDQLAIVVSVASPHPDFMLVDKLLITCISKDIRPLIIINKADLDTSNRIEEIKKVYQNTEFPILVLSKFFPDRYDELHKELVGFVTAFAGQSGVGKSTILNAILNNWVMETGEVSERIQRGKHTTRHVQLFELNKGGFILDTPGFSSFSVQDVNYDELSGLYPEFGEATGTCRYASCSHTGEPDCAIRELLDQGKIDEGRYNRYIELYKELKEIYDNRYRR